MNVQFIRLDNDVCGPLNQMALDERRAVSDLVNQVLREFLKQKGGESIEGSGHAGAGRPVG